MGKNCYSLLKFKPSDEAVVKLMFDFVSSSCLQYIAVIIVRILRLRANSDAKILDRKISLLR